MQKRYQGDLKRLRHIYGVMLMRSGLLRQFTTPTPELGRGRTIFVCKGNIIRSAYAAERARLLGFANVEGAGLCAIPGKAAYEHAIQEAERRGVDLTAHRARHVDELKLCAEDNIFAFEKWQAQRLAQEQSGHIYLMGAWLHSPRPHIDDPYGLPHEYFTDCFNAIDEALDRLRKLSPATGADEGAAA